MTRVYFTDRDLGKQFPRILAEAAISVERHADLFLPDGSDEQWLEYCGTHDRVAITHNSRIRYVPNELAAVKRFGADCWSSSDKVRARNWPGILCRRCLASKRCSTSANRRSILKVYRPTPAEATPATLAA